MVINYISQFDFLNEFPLRMNKISTIKAIWHSIFRTVNKPRKKKCFYTGTVSLCSETKDLLGSNLHTSLGLSCAHTAGWQSGPKCSFVAGISSLPRVSAWRVRFAVLYLSFPGLTTATASTWIISLTFGQMNTFPRCWTPLAEKL